MTVVLIAIFVIVLVVARSALKEAPLFGEVGSWPVAFCTAVLAIMGLLRFLGSPDQSTRTERTPGGGIFDFILLPYATLASAILLVLLLLALGKVRPNKGRMPRDQQWVELPPEFKRLTEQPQAAQQAKPKEEHPAPSGRDRLDDLKKTRSSR